MKTERLEEFKLTQSTRQAINQLLVKCFSEYPNNRTYYKQSPNFRYLVWEDKKLIGHLAIEHRSINIAGTVASIFGVVDICVDQDYHSQSIASTLLKQLEKLGKDHHIDFLVLTAAQHDLYLKHGFELVENTCRWTMINEHQTLGVGHRRIDDCIMQKPLGDKRWKPGILDFLGPIF